MKSDLQLQHDVTEELSWQPSTRDAEIAVSARDGVVTLTGFVRSFAQKSDAEHAVERISGVRAIADDLEVRLPNSSTRTDTDIAHSALLALRWNIQVPDEQIKLTVTDGWITLTGEVQHQFQKESAWEVVHSLTGVKGVRNLLRVRTQKASVPELRQRIADAMRRSATIDASRISVEAHDGTVILRGTVRSWAERLDAERAAWGAPGVGTVEDHLSVGV
jgi:osmotically-inducible protein OsmY